MHKFLIFLLGLMLAHSAQASLSSEYRVQLSGIEKQEIAQKIWLNEGDGKLKNLMVWNQAENFPSLGIGHFIWYPKGLNSPYTESFPGLLTQLQHHAKFPDWLSPSSDAPWASRKEFIAALDSKRSKQLRDLLSQTFVEQLDFIIERLENTLPKILLRLKTPAQRQRVKHQFYRIANSPNGTYALIDYVNFKGEGTSLKERYQNQGWGLLQVLETMDPSKQDVLNEFVQAAKFVLKRRVENAHRTETQWLNGWNKRLSTYIIP